MKTTKFNQIILLGENNGEKIYLSPPSWDCGWYWGFGYLGNKDCHYHVDGLKKIETYDHKKQVWNYELVNLYEGFKRHFGKTLRVRESKLWTLAELFETFYTLKETAEVLGRGGSHLTSNPCKDIIINENEVKRINEIVMPTIFDSIHSILIESENIDSENKKLLQLILNGDTSKVVDFMLEKSIQTDDLRQIKGITNNDFDVIHTVYWKRHHTKKIK
jgi:hypothetical protein